MPYLEIDALRLYYEDAGSGPPLVLLHGGLGAIDDPWSGWGDLAPRFAERCRVVQIEHRGHGRSNNPDDHLAYAQIAADVAVLIERLGLAPAHVAGMSDGGIVALHLAITRPELLRTLIGVGVNYRIDPTVEAATAGFELATIEREHPDWAAGAARLHDRGKPAGWWRELVHQETAMAATQPAYTEDDLRRVPVPALLLAGDDDPYGNPDQMVAMKRAIPQAEILIVNHAGHPIQHTHPWLVGRVIEEFLERQTAPADQPATGDQ